MKRMIKTILTLVVVGIFAFMAYGSGNDKKWESNNKELFCGVQFENSEYLEPIDKEIKKVTIFNIDGTYVSYKNWQAVDESSKQQYRDSGVNSSGADNDFSGTWEIVQPTESMKGDYSTPAETMVDTNTHNCQDPTNRNTFQSKTAMDWQENYDRIKTLTTKK
ncbi:hypothetical protein [Flavobacterium soyae]|uniref:Uncharacterized protein n=1 Tax=Flavobacterium soyae TaxID=2903098 RepID=A0ABZ2UJJ4_9FLAO